MYKRLFNSGISRLCYKQTYRTDGISSESAFLLAAYNIFFPAFLSTFFPSSVEW